MHGGISPDFNDLSDVNNKERPYDVPDDGLICDLLWADPDMQNGWLNSERGISYTFGKDVLKQFVEKHNIDLVCRAH